MPQNFDKLSDHDKNPLLELVSDRMFRFSLSSRVLAQNLDAQLLKESEAYIEQVAKGEVRLAEAAEAAASTIVSETVENNVVELFATDGRSNEKYVNTLANETMTDMSSAEAPAETEEWSNDDAAAA